MQSAPQELEYLKEPTEHHRYLLGSEEHTTENFASRIESPNVASPPSYQSSPSRWTSIPWKFQILSWVGSFCFFIAIIVLLGVLDGRPVPDLQIGITPNAMLGLLATFTELLLVVPVNSAFGQIKWLRALQKRPMDEFRTVDEASRGPWGSVLLLARRKGGLTASFGALVTILALGISTFAQQALRYDTVYPHSDDASLPIAQYMNGSGFAPLGGGIAVFGLDREMLPVPYISLLSRPKTAFTPTVNCATGNCTWESYETLSICSTCENLTSKLKKTKVHIGENNTNFYTLPNGFGLTGSRPRYMTDMGALLNITTTQAPASNGPAGVDWDSIAFANNGSKILSVFAVAASPGTIPEEPDADKSEGEIRALFAAPIAYECLLQVCVRNMRAVFINGTLTETEISSWTDQNQPPPVLPTQLEPDDIVLQPPHSMTTYVATENAVGTMHSWLSTFLIGNVTRPNRGGISNPPGSSGFTDAFFRATNTSMTGFPDLIDNLARSLSLNLRSISYQPAPVRGKAYHSGSHAVVTWPWLILPILELLGSLVFLVVVMVRTRTAGMTPWTNNVLAYFFHGLDERPVRSQVCKSQDIMESEARALLMEFQPHEDGGRLIIVDKGFS